MKIEKIELLKRIKDSLDNIRSELGIFGINGDDDLQEINSTLFHVELYIRKILKG